MFDDFHLVDDAPEVRHILRELLTRGPERMSFVFASRREPPVRLARLRALGEVAELGTNDLRFDAAETARLFSETYEMRLEPAVLAELSRRTEGWPASLQLVRAAIHDRDPAQVRAFIASLSGAEGHLYEYLAEEVVGELRDDLQQFLMRTSVLETVDLTLGPIAAEVSEAETRAFIEDGERHGLFGKGGPHTRHAMRAHPLVRDFLRARLTRAIGIEGVRAIHNRVAMAAEQIELADRSTALFLRRSRSRRSSRSERRHRGHPRDRRLRRCCGTRSSSSTGRLDGAPGLILGIATRAAARRRARRTGSSRAGVGSGPRLELRSF